MLTSDLRGATPALEVIENPISGERITILEPAAATGGDHLAFELLLRPRGRVPSGHIHPNQVETFAVLDGTIRFRRGWHVVHAGPGDSVVMPRGTFHTFLNPGCYPARALVVTRPALRMEDVLRRGAQLGRRQAAAGRGALWAAEVLEFLAEYQAEVAAPLAPAWLVGLAGAAARWLLRMRSRRDPLTVHTTEEGA
ncbi:MAG: cupin domain-containing protein [Candidatus Dormibacteria bacterium]